MIQRREIVHFAKQAIRTRSCSEVRAQFSVLALVGLIEGASYELSHVQLYAGDRVFIGSDGITEALSKKGEMFAEHGLCELLERSRSLCGDRLLKMVVDEVTRFTGSNDLEDDLSAISLGFRAAQ